MYTQTSKPDLDSLELMKCYVETRIIDNIQEIISFFSPKNFKTPESHVAPKLCDVWRPLSPAKAQVICGWGQAGLKALWVGRTGSV